MMVEVSTDEAPFLLDLIEQRRLFGQDRWDEWRHGAYRIMPIPTPEHARLVVAFAAFIDERVTSSRLEVALGINIGVDLEDACVPDIAIFRRDTSPSSEAFLATAQLVVEILSPGEPAGEKMPLYGGWDVNEYLEVDPEEASVRLFANRGGGWTAIDRSSVIDLSVDEVLALLPD
jgi:Uma2 family endonuclease